jgi:hypothetical protein
MKTIWVLTLAAVTALGLLACHAGAQDFAPQNRPPAFGLNPQGPRPDDRKDRQHFGSPLSLLHSLPHGISGAAPHGLPEKHYVNPIPPVVPAESFAPHVPNFNVSSSLPEISTSHFTAPRANWFRSTAGHGALVGIGGGIAAFFGALFGRKKNADA